MKNKKMIFAALAVVSVAVLSGCAFSVDYNPTYVSQEISALKPTIEGKALIYTETFSDEKVYSQNPTSLTGGATKLDAKVGGIVKEIAVYLFSKKFTKGAMHANSLDDVGEYSVVIQPRVTNYQYRYNQLKNLGFAVTPEVKIDLLVSLYNRDKKLISEKTYYTGDYFSGEAYIASFSPDEAVNKTLHVQIYNLLRDVASDVESTLGSQ